MFATQLQQRLQDAPARGLSACLPVCPPLHRAQEKAKKPKGRAAQRLKYNRRFVNVVAGFGGKSEWRGGGQGG